jgi:ABC-type Fe3+ transport system permease subunit
MSYFTAALILLICVALAVLVCVPFIYIVRKFRRRQGGQQQGLSINRLSVVQALPGLILVLVLFFAFAHQYIAPESWLESRLKTDEGRFWFWVLASMVFALLPNAWGRLKARRSKLAESTRTPKDRAGSEPPDDA